MSFDLAIAVILAGMAVGVLSALFGVGGGILMVPFMVLVLNETQHVAEGTSLLVIVPTAVIGVLAHRRGDFVDFRAAALMAVGGMGGAVAGATLALRLAGETLETMFGVLMALVGTRTVIKGVKQIHSERSQVV